MQLVNWLLYYRDKLFNKTLDELRAARLAESPAAVGSAPTTAAGGEERDVGAGMLPSERNYQKLRLD
jgi:hypothetical protein